MCRFVLTLEDAFEEEANLLGLEELVNNQEQRRHQQGKTGKTLCSDQQLIRKAPAGSVYKPFVPGTPRKIYMGSSGHGSLSAFPR
jgi:hypothetical protein